MTKIQRGLKPKDRKLATTTKKNKLTANQWQNTPQQNLFMEYWLTPTSETFSNSYRSALKAKYSPHYALVISAPTTANKWITEYLKATNMDSEHIKQSIQDVYLNPKTYEMSRSPADTRVKALELLARVTGLLDNKHTTNVTVVQPILGGNSTPKEDRVVIDAIVS
jgi:hypothetical protein